MQYAVSQIELYSEKSFGGAFLSPIWRMNGRMYFVKIELGRFRFNKHIFIIESLVKHEQEVGLITHKWENRQTLIYSYNWFSLLVNQLL